LLIFAKYLSLYVHIFTCTYRGTHTQAHMYNQHTRGMATTRYRSLVERGGKKALLETLHKQNKKCQENLIFTNLKKKIREASSKATRLFLTKSNKSNINQCNLLACNLQSTCSMHSTSIRNLPALFLLVILAIERSLCFYLRGAKSLTILIVPRI